MGSVFTHTATGVESKQAMALILTQSYNVVGNMQTHGVGYDFLQKLNKDNRHLEILGDGNQRKSYIHVTDVVW